MGQKVHPLGYRLGVTQKHLNYWYTKTTKSAYWLQDAIFLRNYIENTFSKAGIAKIEIRKCEYVAAFISIKIVAVRPFLILNNFSDLKNKNFINDAIKKFEKTLLDHLKNYYKIRKTIDFGEITCKISIEKITSPDSFATLIADKLINDLEHRKPFRKSMKFLVKKAKEAGVQGIKIQVSGRLNGADIARSIKLQSGELPLQTLRAKIDYSSKPAKTKYGLLGVKVWVFRGEELAPLSNY